MQQLQHCTLTYISIHKPSLYACVQVSIENSFIMARITLSAITFIIHNMCVTIHVYAWLSYPGYIFIFNRKSLLDAPCCILVIALDTYVFSSKFSNALLVACLFGSLPFWQTIYNQS